MELPQTALMPEAWYFPEGGLIPEVWFVPHFAGARGEVDPCAICMVWAIPERRPHPYGYASDKLSKGYSYLILLIVTYFSGPPPHPRYMWFADCRREGELWPPRPS